MGRWGSPRRGGCTAIPATSLRAANLLRRCIKKPRVNCYCYRSDDEYYWLVQTVTFRSTAGTLRTCCLRALAYDARKQLKKREFQKMTEHVQDRHTYREEVVREAGQALEQTTGRSRRSPRSCATLGRAGLCGKPAARRIQILLSGALGKLPRLKWRSSITVRSVPTAGSVVGASGSGQCGRPYPHAAVPATNCATKGSAPRSFRPQQALGASSYCHTAQAQDAGRRAFPLHDQPSSLRFPRRRPMMKVVVVLGAASGRQPAAPHR